MTRTPGTTPVDAATRLQRVLAHAQPAAAPRFSTRAEGLVRDRTGAVLLVVPEDGIVRDADGAAVALVREGWWVCATTTASRGIPWGALAGWTGDSATGAVWRIGGRLADGGRLAVGLADHDAGRAAADAMRFLPRSLPVHASGRGADAFATALRLAGFDARADPHAMPEPADAALLDAACRAGGRSLIAMGSHGLGTAVPLAELEALVDLARRGTRAPVGEYGGTLLEHLIVRVALAGTRTVAPADVPSPATVDALHGTLWSALSRRRTWTLHHWREERDGHEWVGAVVRLSLYRVRLLVARPGRAAVTTAVSERPEGSYLREIASSRAVIAPCRGEFTPMTRTVAVDPAVVDAIYGQAARLCREPSAAGVVIATMLLAAPPKPKDGGLVELVFPYTTMDPAMRRFTDARQWGER